MTSRITRAPPPPRRWRLPALAAAIAVVVAFTMVWCHDDLAQLLRAKPSPERILGEWTYDAAAADAMLAEMAAAPVAPGDGAVQARRERFRRTLAACRALDLVLAAGTCTIDRHNGRTEAIPCRYQPDGPDGIVVESSDPARPWRIALVFDPAQPEVMRWSEDGEALVPMRRK